ncbi:MAG TPA: HlyD family efflux transporter periplasmic adaptor subunit [Anaerovoracaceae bacterium]|nr:HlyD family efflux transporter periplasmic adaptor subunit [Anaerovoracaceae bacterium]
MKVKKRIIMLFCVALAILFIIIYVYPNVTGALKKTEIIEYGSLQVTDQVTAYIVRNETVYFADKPGSIQYNAEEGEQVRKGARILDIIPGGQQDKESSYQNLMERISRFNGGESLFSDDIKKIRTQNARLENERDAAMNAGEQEQAARLEQQLLRLRQKLDYIQATDAAAKEEIIGQNKLLNATGIATENYISQSNGIISYYIDGYESEFTPENMTLLSREKVQRLNIEVQNMTREATLKDEPLYKIVDQKKWYSVFWVAPENIVKYEKGKKVTLNLPLGQVDGTVYDIIDDSGQWLVILEFNRYYEEFAQIRKADAEVVTSDYSGLIIKNENLTSRDGQPGVFVKDKSGEYVFKPVKIITSDGEWSLVEVSYFYTDSGEKVDTVNIYDEILREPN